MQVGASALYRCLHSPSGRAYALRVGLGYLSLAEIDWPNDANCVKMNVDMFPRRAEEQKYTARGVCFSCRVRRDCLVEALNRREEFGVWGGMTERERRRILKKNPNVKDWNKVFLGERTVAA